MRHMEFNHELKVWSKYFVPITYGLKRFEIRKDEDQRVFRYDDLVRLRETDQLTGEYTGREMAVQIDYVTDFLPVYTVFGFHTVGVQKISWPAEVTTDVQK